MWRGHDGLRAPLFLSSATPCPGYLPHRTSACLTSEIATRMSALSLRVAATLALALMVGPVLSAAPAAPVPPTEPAPAAESETPVAFPLTRIVPTGEARAIAFLTLLEPGPRRHPPPEPAQARPRRHRGRDILPALRARLAARCLQRPQGAGQARDLRGGREVRGNGRVPDARHQRRRLRLCCGRQGAGPVGQGAGRFGAGRGCRAREPRGLTGASAYPTLTLIPRRRREAVASTETSTPRRASWGPPSKRSNPGIRHLWKRPAALDCFASLRFASLAMTVQALRNPAHGRPRKAIHNSHKIYYGT